eukprot:1119985-Prorocentrum_minimum.AAC.2
MPLPQGTDGTIASQVSDGGMGGMGARMAELDAHVLWGWRVGQAGPPWQPALSRTTRRCSYRSSHRLFSSASVHHAVCTVLKDVHHEGCWGNEIMVELWGHG